MIKIITIVAFSLFSFIIVVIVALLRLKGKGSFGKPSLPVYIFAVGKLSLFACFGLYVYAMLKNNFVNPFFSAEIEYLAFAIFIFGMGITITGLINLGLSLRMGLPEEETELKTKGIYRLTRNPIYVGFNIICLASVLNYPEIANLFFFVTVCVYHHFVIKAEEGFLAKRFGNSWKDYIKKTRRYL